MNVGMNWHARVLKLGLATNPIAATRLLNAYMVERSPNSLNHAYRLFDEVPFKDTTLWTSIISAYNRAGDSHKALQLFGQMLHQSRPNHFVYASVARACASSETHLPLGKTIHSLVLKDGFLQNVAVGTSLLDMYAKCRLVESASNLFNEMPDKNIISWNAMIAAYLSNGMEVVGLEMFFQMKCLEFVLPDEFTFATVLTACACLNYLNLGMQVHANLMIVGYEMECASSICNMYLRCNKVSLAEKLFREAGEKFILKLLMIKGYVLNGSHHDGIQLMARDYNLAEIVKIDPSVVVSILSACADLSLLRLGRQAHGFIITLFGSRYNCQSENDDAIIVSALIDMYCKCSCVKEAQRVFDGLLPATHVSHWNAMMNGYISNGLLGNASDCFEEMEERNVVSWTTMITGYVNYGLPHEALRLVAQMYGNRKDPIQGNCLTFTVSLEACSLLTLLEVGRQIHAKLIRTIVNADTGNVVVGTALVDMYSKSGNLNYAERVFGRMIERNVVSWTSMIMGYAIHGLSLKALDVFEQMMSMGYEPNEVTFVSVLTSCSHGGLVDKGMRYFKLMMDKFRIVPRGDHCTCVVDLLGRAGRLTEALSLAEKIEGDEASNNLCGGAIWGALLGACKLYGNVEIGTIVAEKLLGKKQQISDTYIAISNIYAAAGRWEDASKLREKWKTGVSDVGKAGQSMIHL